MSVIHYYVTVFPTEALIASMLTPDQFGAYMTTSAKKGSHEILLFIELTSEFGSDFDWGYAANQCTPHLNGDPKHSVYLSAYRVLEKIPTQYAGNLHLTTADGRTIAVHKKTLGARSNDKTWFLYQELCPVQPLIVSSLSPLDFGRFIVSGTSKISFPSLLYCDVKVVDMNDPVHTGNVGSIYDRNLWHLNDCILAVTKYGKTTKILDRSFASSFCYQIVKNGFYFITQADSVWYPMPSDEELNAQYYDWARSALLR